MAHHTLYQVSTATALVEGIYQGAVRVGTLHTHGDLGPGIFENFDGCESVHDRPERPAGRFSSTADITSWIRSVSEQVLRLKRADRRIQRSALFRRLLAGTRARHLFAEANHANHQIRQTRR